MPFNKTRKSSSATNLFDDLDAFLTGLIVERAPAADRGSLHQFFSVEGGKAVKARPRKKGSLAQVL